MNLFNQYKERVQNFSNEKKALLAKKLGYDICKDQLIAYIVLKDGQSLDQAHLTQFLGEKIPDYMIPNSIVVVDKLPLTENSKVNMDALPLPKPNRAIISVEPSNQTEKIIYDIWQQVLTINAISIHDNFFYVGGHSILATQIMSRIRRVFNKNFPISVLFENPTIVSLAKWIDGYHCFDDNENIKITQLAHKTDLPLSFSQEQFWIISQLDPLSYHYNMPGGIRIEGKLNLIAMEKTINAIIERHEILRTTFYMHESGMPRQRVANDLFISLQSITAASESIVSEICLIEAQKPFDLQRGPLIRFKLIRCHEKKHFLVVVMHHIVADGWSIQLFLKELLLYYPHFCTHNFTSLPPLPIQYKDYASWERNQSQTNDWNNKITYWKSQLADAPPLLFYLTDKARGPKQTFNGSLCEHHYHKSLSKKIHAFCKSEDVTFFMVLVMAYQILLKYHSGQNDILIGTPVANRNTPESEEMIGCFINTIILRTRFTAMLTVRDILVHVKTMLLQASNNQDLSINKIIDSLKIERYPSFSPLFQVMLVLQNADDFSQKISLPELNIYPFEINNGSAKFDLTLSINETDAGFMGRFEYNTDIFYEKTIWAMINNFENLLEQIISYPDYKITELPFFSANHSYQTPQQNTNYIVGEL